MAAERRYWLMKSEPDVFSIEDLRRSGTTSWDGVRNYQARNFMRDEMKVGDLVLFYHSNASPSGVAGLARVCREAHADLTAQDPASPYYDAKATAENPVWMMVDVEFISAFPHLVALDELRQDPLLADMHVLKKGQRLSVQPVERQHFERVLDLGNPRPERLGG
jgi:predicted RNA-binding protein with PUA-like domain